MRGFRGERQDRDAGAVAVFTAILAVVILVVSALAVEVTNLYATDRASQRSVDLAATSAAQFLPDTCSAVNEAYRAMRDNPIPDTPPTPTLTTFVDGNPVNGEIQVLLNMETAPVPFGANTAAVRGSGAWVDASGCAEVGRPGVAQADAAQGRPRMVRVMSPTAEVPFRLGRAFSLDPVGNGVVPESLSAIRMATAGIVGSGRGVGYGLMPVAIPAGCAVGFGPKTIKTAPNSFPDSVDFQPPGNNNGPRITSPLNSSGVPIAYTFEAVDVAAGGVVVDFNLTQLSTDPRTAAGAISVDFHTNPSLVTSTTTRVPAPTVPVSGAVATVVGTPVLISGGPNAGWSATIRIAVPSSMSTPLGVWLVRAAQLQASGGGARWTGSDFVGEILIKGPFYTGGDCNDSNQGNFGLIRAERFTGSGNQFEVNVARGLDHTLTAFPTGALPPPGPLTTVCPSNGSPPGALLDPTPGVPVDGANCIQIESGNMAGPLTQGLITGTNGSPSYPGRLARDTAFSKPATAPSSCVSSATGPNNFLWRTPTQNNVSVINTVLSCYLAPGSSLTDVRNGQPESLIEAIYADPRFFFVPIFNGDGRPPNANNHYAIKGFVGAFITSQQLNGSVTCGTGRRNNTCNGIEIGSQQVFSLSTFIFPVSALPAQTNLPVEEGPEGFEDFIAGTKEIVLFE